MMFFTSDTHFNTKETMLRSKRPFHSVQEMNEKMINNINNTVGKDDFLFHLGDFGDYEFINQINCKVILIFGNHEFEYMQENNLSESEFKNKLLEMGFYKIYFKKCLIKTNDKHKQNIFHLAHSPEDYSVNAFNLFGHLHNLQMVKKIKNKFYGLNVGVDCQNFKPMSLESVRSYETNMKFFDERNVFI